MVSVTKTVRDSITSLVADPSVGFNPTLVKVCNDYNVQPFLIDFSNNSRNFFAGYYGAKAIMETTNTKFPLICLYTIKSTNTNQQKFQVFSGTILLGIDVYLSYGKSSAFGNTDLLADAVEDTIYNVFNSEANYGFYSAASGDLEYNGDISVTRSSLTKDAYNWLQALQVRFTVDFFAS